MKENTLQPCLKHGFRKPVFFFLKMSTGPGNTRQHSRIQYRRGEKQRHQISSGKHSVLFCRCINILRLSLKQNESQP